MIFFKKSFFNICYLIIYLFMKVKIRINGEVPVHVDGEPWSQPPCSITIIKSALKVNKFKISLIIKFISRYDYI